MSLNRIERPSVTSLASPSAQAEHFRSLHRPGVPLVLVNVWDVGSALTVEGAGAPAVATSSWAVARARGFGDGEQIPFGLVLDLVAALGRRVTVPITVDLESGYGRSPADVGENVRRALVAGAVGCNLEDAGSSGSGLRDVADQCARLRQARDASDRLGFRAFINARTDVFLNDPEAGPAGVGEALKRAAAYAEAGADGLFVPGLQDLTGIAELVEGSPLPLNVMVDTEPDRHTWSARLAALAEAGVARISCGASPYLTAMSTLPRHVPPVTTEGPGNA